MGTPTQAQGNTIQFWRRARLAYRAGLILFFGPIALYFGPNYIMFRRLTWIEPDYFAASATKNVVPIIRAIKEYAADYGKLPSDQRPLDDLLVPQYLPQPSYGSRYRVRMRNDGTAEYWSEWNHHIVYDFTPGREGWSVRGPLTSGPLDLPLVAAGTTRRATSRSTTQSN